MAPLCPRWAARARGVAGGVAVDEVEGRAGQERQVHLEQGDVEADRGDGRPPVAGAEGDACTHVGEEVAQAQFRYGHTLGASGGAGGVQDVGQRVAGHGLGGRAFLLRSGFGGLLDEQPGGALRQAAAEFPVGQEHQGAGVLEHVGDAVPREVGVQGEEGGTGPGHGDQGRGQVGAAGQGDGDGPFRAGPACAQVRGEEIGASVELGVGELLPCRAHGDGPRVLAGAGADLLGHGGRRQLAFGGKVDHPVGPAFLAGDGVRVPDGCGPGGVGSVEAVEEAGELGGAPPQVLSRVALGVGVELEPQPAGGAVRVHGEGQVVDRSLGEGACFGAHVAEAQVVVEGLDVDHRPVQPALPADEPEVAPDVLGTVVLVGAEFAEPCAHLPHEVGGGAVGLHPHTEREDVDDHGGNAERGRPEPAHGGHADHDVTVAGGPVDVGGERGDEGLGPVGAGRPGDAAQRGEPVLAEGAVFPAAAVGRGRGCGAEHGGFRAALQRAGPVLAVPGLAFGAGVGLLLGDDLGEGAGAGRGCALPVPVAVDLGHAPVDHGDRVGVDQDVVVALEPHPVVVGHAQQREREEQAAGPPHRVGHALAHPLLGGIAGVAGRAQVDHLQVPGGVRPDLLHGGGPVLCPGCPVLGHDVGPQRLGLPDGPAQGGLEQRGVDVTGQVDVLADVVGGCAVQDLLGVPDPGLRAGQSCSCGHRIGHGVGWFLFVRRSAAAGPVQRSAVRVATESTISATRVAMLDNSDAETPWVCSVPPCR